MKTLLLIFAYALLPVSANLMQSNDPNSKIKGVWWNEEKSSRVEVYEKNGKIHAKIVWLKDNTNPDGSTPRKDYNNPDAKLKQRLLIGCDILTALRWDEKDKEWDSGEIYDPKSGKTYSCYAVLQQDGTLFLKGYVLGMPFLGRSTTWTRYQAPK
jgi:uncharacterized protein (DUF2147 family)